jgi:catechol 2,3-dioxygenase-like lactoylglutathione lyase family enzyme
MATTTPRLFRVILPVADIDHAARFYGVILGIEGRRVSPGRHYFDCGGTILACLDPGADGDSHTSTPNPECLYFAVDDLEAVFAACRSAGAAFEPGEVHGDPAGEIARRPWGERSFYIRDLDGNPLCFVDSATLYTG